MKYKQGFGQSQEDGTPLADLVLATIPPLEDQMIVTVSQSGSQALYKESAISSVIYSCQFLLFLHAIK